VQRYYSNTFTDQEKQNSINVFLGVFKYVLLHRNIDIKSRLIIPIFQAMAESHPDMGFGYWLLFAYDWTWANFIIVRNFVI